MRIRVIVTAAAFGLGACAAVPETAAPVQSAPPIVSKSGLERVLDHNAAALVALLGQPDLDVREDQARKLQFAGPICVLDAYLYPKGGREPVVTYVDARQPDGRDIDRASCVSALAANRKR